MRTGITKTRRGIQLQHLKNPTVSIPIRRVVHVSNKKYYVLFSATNYVVNHEFTTNHKNQPATPPVENMKANQKVSSDDTQSDKEASTTKYSSLKK